MEWTHTKVGSALHVNGTLVATIKIRPMGITARWHNDNFFDVRDQCPHLSEAVAMRSRVRAFKTKSAAISAIEKALK